jgi:RecA/RadA recombinase
MGLRGKKPEEVEKRLKALFYGEAGSGKTFASIQFPKPYIIDTERGSENTQYIKMLNKKGGAIFQSSDFNEVVAEIIALLSEDHEYKTLIIDPITTIYDNLLDTAAKEVGTDFGRHYGEANKKMKHIINLLLRLDMNVIITAHSKNQYGKDLAIIGQTFDGYKKLDYLFDLVMQIQRIGGKRIAFVKKSRVETIKEDDNFEFSYSTLSDLYGKDIIEKKSTSKVLASNDDVKELLNLIEVMKVPDNVIDKWLSKSKSSNFNEMEKSCIENCIKYLKDKIQ